MSILDHSKCVYGYVCVRVCLVDSCMSNIFLVYYLFIYLIFTSSGEIDRVERGERVPM